MRELTIVIGRLCFAIDRGLSQEPQDSLDNVTVVTATNGLWMDTYHPLHLHGHTFHHMMNSMTSQAGPIVRQFSKPNQLKVPGYPQDMLGMESMDMADMKMADTKMDGMKMDGIKQVSKPRSPYAMDMSWMGMIESRREAAGMWSGWSMGVEGLTTVLRVLPRELFDKLTTTSEIIEPNTSTRGELAMRNRRTIWNMASTRKENSRLIATDKLWLNCD